MHTIVHCTTCTLEHTAPNSNSNFRTLRYQRTVLRYWRDAGWVRGTTSQLRRLRLITRTTLSLFHINLYSQTTPGSQLLTLTPEECCVGSIPCRTPIAFVAIRCACRSADGTMAYTCCTALCLSEVRCQTNPTRDR